MDLAEVRERVATVAHRLAADGLVLGTAGNVSQRVDDRVAITPTGAVLGDLDPGDVCVVDLDGRHVEGPLAPTSELDLHLGAMRHHGCGAVVHTHAPMSTAAACVVDELPCVHYAMLALGGPVPVAPYRTFGTPELADTVVAALASRTSVLMANHGAVTVADTVEAALELSLLLEWAATSTCMPRPRHPRAGRAGGPDPRLDRARLRAPRLPPAKRRAGACAVGGRRPRGRRSPPARARHRLRGRHGRSRRCRGRLR